MKLRSAITIFLATMITWTAHGETKLLWHHVVDPLPEEHNAFTDIARWKGSYWLCFRNGEHHVSMDGTIQIMRSDDMKTWTPVTVIRTQGDDRDPHLTVTDDRLYCYFGVWDTTFGEGTNPPDRHQVRSHVSWTDNGKNWSKVHACWEPGWWMWRVRELDGVLYGAAYTAVRPRPDMRETLLLKSTNGYTWEKVSMVTNKGSAGESDFWLDDEGRMTLVTRTEKNAWIYQSTDATFTKWDGHELEGLVHAPVAAFWNDRIFLAGRDKNDDGKSITRIWELKEGAIERLFVMPSAGDTSYCGLIPNPTAPKDGPPQLYISWYSQHESEGRDAKVFVGELSVE